MKLLVPFAAALMMLVLPARAADTSALLDRWYAALVNGTDAEIAAMLADNATIVLEDIGVEQSKAEFVASLPEWHIAIRGGTVEHRIVKSGDEEAVALVCYRFAENEMTVRERFEFAGDLVIKSIQTQTADNCDGF